MAADEQRSKHLPEVEKTSLFGTAVHAVLRPRRNRRRRVCESAGSPGPAGARRRRVAPSLEDVFLDVVERMAEAR